MDPAGGVGGGGGREEAERWLSIAEKLVAARDFVSCRHFAERALELYPLLDPGAAAAERILATVDVLITAQATPRPSPYSILQVDPNSALPAITRAFRRLAFLLRPDSKPSAAAADAYKLVSDAFSLLSDPSKKGLIDAELKNSSNPANPPSSAASSAFWTVCPSCHHIHEYACEFRDRMLRCPRCKKAFKASELPAPPPIVPGTDMYYCSWGFYPIGIPSAADIASGWKPFIPMFPRPQPASATADGNVNSQVEMESGKDKKEVQAAVPVGRNKKKMARKRAGVNLKRRVLGGSPAMPRPEAWEGTEMKDSRVNINVGKGGVDVHREVVGNVKAGKVGEGGNVGSVHIDLEAEDVDATDDVLDGGDVPKGSAEIFFRKVKFWKEDEAEEAPPIFNVDGVNYIHVKVVGLLFVATTRVNVSPSLVLELLQRIARVIKDYLGVLNEDSLRKNFVLVYELLDEIIDFGYPQTTSTEVLKSYIFNEPIVVDAARLPPLGPASIFMQGAKRMPSTAVTKSVVANEPGGRKREEIFVDIIEKISVTFSSSGYILTSEIDGTIQMKSYLTGNPEIRLALNEDLSIGRMGASVYDYHSSVGGGVVILDDCNFHESVHLDSFDMDRTLALVPPDGEFSVMNYRMTQEFKPPFHINTLIEEAGSSKAGIILKIRADFPSSITANTIIVQMPLPTYTARVSFELETGAVGQTTDFKEGNKKLEWSLKKIVGGSEHTLRAKLTFSQELHGNITKEAGPISMNFMIPMYNASRLQVRYLQIAKKSKVNNLYRWVRYVTQANSYVARL